MEKAICTVLMQALETQLVILESVLHPTNSQTGQRNRSIVEGSFLLRKV
jgi:hypothetical protein